MRIRRITSTQQPAIHHHHSNTASWWSAARPLAPHRLPAHKWAWRQPSSLKREGFDHKVPPLSQVSASDTLTVVSVTTTKVSSRILLRAPARLAQAVQAGRAQCQTQTGTPRSMLSHTRSPRGPARFATTLLIDASSPSESSMPKARTFSAMWSELRTPTISAPTAGRAGN